MQVTIRPARMPEDAEGLTAIRLMRGLMDDIDSIPSETSDWNARRLQNEEGSFMFVAEAALSGGEKQLIGSIRLSVDPSWRMRHCGTLSGLMVHEDYRRRGVGTKLVGAALDLADNWLRLIRQQLVVVTSNTGAVQLYEKMGFEKEALLRKTVAMDGGLYGDDYLMARIR